MQKILIIYSQEGKIKDIADGIAEGAKNKGNQVDLISTEERGRLVTFSPYDLVIVGSPTRGFFKGKIADDLPPFLGNCKRTTGKTTMAFVTPKAFATTRALKLVMAELEKLGCIVKNFASLKNRTEAVAFGQDI
jgi:menaquinone-dependent protoporphyrinogen IX oxidase